MLIKYTLTYGEWKKISNYGQNGTAWLKTADGFNPNIKISHSDRVDGDDIVYASTEDLDIDSAYTLPNHESSDILIADNYDDIFYATVLNPGKTCEIIVDFVDSYID